MNYLIFKLLELVLHTCGCNQKLSLVKISERKCVKGTNHTGSPLEVNAKSVNVLHFLGLVLLGRLGGLVIFYKWHEPYWQSTKDKCKKCKCPPLSMTCFVG